MDDKINSTTTGTQNQIEIPEARDALDAIKYQVANSIGVKVPKNSKGKYDWRMVPSYYCGAVGGEMVKRMMQFAEKMAAQGHNVLLQEEGEGTAPHFAESSPPMPFNGQENQLQ